MHERLLEGWLDSASEKSYQTPFCQMLAGKGHTVIHSTRHCALEFGKDILTIDDDDVPCAYQLKGNPGGRLSLREFQKIQGQLVQLVTQPIVFPDGRSRGNHKSYLVTNGEAEEEVHRAIDDLNRTFEKQGAVGAPLNLITRGTLLDWSKDLGTSLWPSEIEDIDKLLNLLVWNGNDQFPEQEIHDLLVPLLGLSPGDARLNAAALKRRITSAAIITSVSLRNFTLKNNHFAELKAWIIYSYYSIAACGKHDRSYKRNAEMAVTIAEEAIFDCLADLCEEISERSEKIGGELPDYLLIEGVALTDNIAYRGRFNLIVSLLSLYWFWCEERGWPSEKQKEFVERYMPSDFKKHLLWGEAAIPQYLVFLWYLRAKEKGPKPDYMLKGLLDGIISMNTNHETPGLASPYYTYEDYVRHNLQSLLGLKEDPYQGDSFHDKSYFTEGLMHLLVRTNLKGACKEVWPAFSKLGLSHFNPEKDWQYCLWRCEEGEEIMLQPPLTKEWADLVHEARDATCKGVPDPLKKHKYLLMLWTIIFPYRAVPTVIRFLGHEFNECWFIDPPLEN